MLPTIEQDFEANVQPYIDEIQRAISITNDLRDSVQEAIDRIALLKSAIAGLDGKTITVNVDVEMPPLPPLVQPLVTATGGAGDLGGLQETVTDLAATVTQLGATFQSADNAAATTLVN